MGASLRAQSCFEVFEIAPILYLVLKEGIKIHYFGSALLIFPIAAMSCFPWWLNSLIGG